MSSCWVLGPFGPCVVVAHAFPPLPLAGVLCRHRHRRRRLVFGPELPPGSNGGAQFGYMCRLANAPCALGARCTPPPHTRTHTHIHTLISWSSGPPPPWCGPRDSGSRLLALAAHLASVNRAPDSLQASPEGLAVWLQELYCRAHALQVVARWGQRGQPGGAGGYWW